MDLLAATPVLVEEFRHVLQLCRVRPSEVVVVFTDARFPHPEYAPAGIAAARGLGATTYLLVAGAEQDLEDEMVRAAWTHADLVLGMSFLPGPYSWMYSAMHSAALARGARVLMVQESPGVLRRLLPSEVVLRKGRAGALLLEQAQEVHLTSRAGTDLTFLKTGRKGSYQWGVADVPGRWDHWPSGMVYCAPLEDSARGVLCIQPSDVLLGLRCHASSPVHLSFESGRLIEITGGPDARRVKELLRRAGDEGAYRLAHVGWGTDDRAEWQHVGMDSESYYGGITVALGRNTFDSPTSHCGLGGSNVSGVHLDLCMRGASLYVDGRAVIEEGGFVPRELV